MNKAPSISHNSGTDGIVSGLYLKDTTIQNNWQKTIKWDMLTRFGYDYAACERGGDVYGERRQGKRR